MAASPARFVDPALSWLDGLQKSLRPTAFAYGVVKKYSEDAGSRLAATVAYYGFFSVFPSILALVAIGGFVLDNSPDLRSDLVDSALAQFPVIGGGIAEESIGGSGLALLAGVGAALWAGMGAFLAAQYALNQVWDVPHHDRPNVAVARGKALLMFAVFGLGLTAATILTNLAAKLSLPGVTRFGVLGANVAIDIAVAWVSFRVLTARKLRWSEHLPGAVIAGVGYFVLQTTGSALVDRFVSSASDTYGAFAIVIGLLVWFHLLSQVTLLAAVANVVRARELWPRTLWGDDLTPGDERALRRYREAAARRPGH